MSRPEERDAPVPDLPPQPGSDDESESRYPPLESGVMHRSTQVPAEEETLLEQIALQARKTVGKEAAIRVTDTVREAMVREALLRERGNITRAAALLGMTRQAVQQWVQRLKLSEWLHRLRE